MTSNTRTCLDCQIDVISSRREWDQLTTKQRTNKRRHGGRGLCNICHGRRKRTGTLRHLPVLRNATPIDHLLEDLEVLGFDHNKPARPQLRALASRLPIKWESAERALSRYNAKTREEAA